MSYTNKTFASSSPIAAPTTKPVASRGPAASCCFQAQQLQHPSAPTFTQHPEQRKERSRQSSSTPQTQQAAAEFAAT